MRSARERLAGRCPVAATPSPPTIPTARRTSRGRAQRPPTASTVAGAGPDPLRHLRPRVLRRRRRRGLPGPASGGEALRRRRDAGPARPDPVRLDRLPPAPDPAGLDARQHRARSSTTSPTTATGTSRSARCSTPGSTSSASAPTRTSTRSARSPTSWPRRPTTPRCRCRRAGARVPPTYAAARAALLDHARLVDAQERDLPGTELSFHEAGASPWRRGQLPLPLQGPGGPLVTVVAPLQPTQAAASAIELILQGQTLHRWELLLVGDDARRSRRSCTTGGPGWCRLAPGADWRNAGLAEAAGTYVAFLMPGHHWRADFLQGAVQWLNDSGHEAGHARGLAARRDRPGDGDVGKHATCRPCAPAAGSTWARWCADRGRAGGRWLRAGAGSGRRARVRDPVGRRGPGSTRSPSSPATGWCRRCPGSRRPPRAPTATGWR